MPKPRHKLESYNNAGIAMQQMTQNINNQEHTHQERTPTA